MKKSTETFWLLFLLILVIIPVSPLYAQWDPEGPAEAEAVVVGRLSHVEGTVSHYLPDEDRWIRAEADTPFGMDDILQSGRDGRAELIIPNNTWIRINNDTQIRLVSLRADLTDVSVDAGIVRFYNKGSDAVIRASTPFGSVSASSRCSFDLYVDDTSLEVIALTGTVSFARKHGREEYQVIAGSSSLVADRRQVTAGEGIHDPDWVAWNKHRDNLWHMRTARSGESRNYLPDQLSDEAYVLDSYGRWTRVYYDGAYRTFWHPIHVSIRWTPFSVGRWMMWHGDYCWLSGEPFGYVTHHYGNWILVNNLWYWAPPVTGIKVRFGFPSLHIGLASYPGRVGWIRSGLLIGRVPLLRYEPHYCRRRWKPRVIMLKNLHTKTIIIKRKAYRYTSRTVILRKGTHRRISRSKKTRAFARRKNRTSPSLKPFPRKFRKKPELRRVKDLNRIRHYRRTVVGKRYEAISKATTRRRHQTLENIHQRPTTYLRLPSVMSRTDRSIKKTALRGKRQKRLTANPVIFRDLKRVKRSRPAAREKHAFHRKKQRRKAQQARRTICFRKKLVRKRLYRTRSRREGRSAAMERVER